MFKQFLLPFLATLSVFAAGPEVAKAPSAPKGTLVIVGGGSVPKEIKAAFLAACGGKGARVGIVPTSTIDPVGALKGWKSELENAGLVMVPLDIRKREEASAPAILEAAKQCTGFWFSGGDQNLVGDKIVGTPLQKILLERYAAGAVIGGTSAGAAIMSPIMLTGDDRNGKGTLTELGKGAYRTREGMGFLPRTCIVDQHFLRRNRQNRLFSIMLDHPDCLGLGIDESTALVVKDGKATVIGLSGVMVFDPLGMTPDTSGGFQNMQIHLLRNGQSLDLTTRKVAK